MSKTITVAFDLYGTILSTSSVAAKLSELLSIPSEKAQAVAELWRRYQLEYTWRCNSMQKYIPFTTITLTSLHHALKESSVSIPSGKAFDEKIMQSYNELHTFPDAEEALSYLSISSQNKVQPHIFSNGTTTMLTSSFQSPHLKSHASVFKSIVSVEETKRFKPAPEVYEHLAKSVGCEIGELWLVSGNPFDVVGAKGAGMRACWIDRSEKGWMDCLGGEPDLIVKGVKDAVKEIEKFGSSD